MAIISSIAGSEQMTILLLLGNSLLQVISERKRMFVDARYILPGQLLNLL